MAKLNEEAATELPLNDERLPVKKNRHVVIALNHLTRRLKVLMAQKDKIDAEIKDVGAAIQSLEG